MVVILRIASASAIATDTVTLSLEERDKRFRSILFLYRLHLTQRAEIVLDVLEPVTKSKSFVSFHRYRRQGLHLQRSLNGYVLLASLRSKGNRCFYCFAYTTSVWTRKDSNLLSPIGIEPKLLRRGCAAL